MLEGWAGSCSFLTDGRKFFWEKNYGTNFFDRLKFREELGALPPAGQQGALPPAGQLPPAPLCHKATDISTGEHSAYHCWAIIA